MSLTIVSFGAAVRVGGEHDVDGAPCAARNRSASSQPQGRKEDHGQEDTKKR